MSHHLPVGRSPRAVLFLLLAGAALSCARASDPVIGADAPAGRLHSWDCPSGTPLGEAALPGPLTAVPVVDSPGARVYAAAAGALRALSLPGLALEASRQLSVPVTRLALGSGAGAVLLVAGGGAGEPAAAAEASAAARPAAAQSAAAQSAASPPHWMLGAYRPDDLAPVFAWTLPAAGEVSAVLAIEARHRFVLGFAAHDEIWEIAWNPDAPPVLRGLVHDYRSAEAVPLPGRFTERAFKLPQPTGDLAPGGVPYEVLQIDRHGAAGIVNLDIRRRTETVPIEAVRFITPWRGQGARGWLVFHGDGRITRVSAPDARQQAWGRLPAAPVDVIAAPDGSGAIALAGDGRGFGLWRVSALTASASLAAFPPSGRPVAGAHRLAVSGAGTCIALLDGQGRWLGSQTLGTAR